MQGGEIHLGVKKGRKLLYFNWDRVFEHLRDCKICQSKQPCDFKTLSNVVWDHMSCKCEICKLTRNSTQNPTFYA
jgi:hypothetical protein